MNTKLYAETIRLNDQLLPIYNKIGHSMPRQDVTNVGRSLLQKGSEMRALLDKHNAATPERCAQLDRVKDETLKADAAANGNANAGLDTWAALIRAHGCINNVIVDVLDKMG